MVQAWEPQNEDHASSLGVITGDIISSMSAQDDEELASLVAAAKWTPSAHPRGKDGKFIKKGALQELLSAKTVSVTQVLNAADDLTADDWQKLTSAQQDYVQTTLSKLPATSNAGQKAAAKLAEVKAASEKSTAQKSQVSAGHKGKPGDPAKVTTSLIWGKHEPGTVILESPDGTQRVTWTGKKYVIQDKITDTGEWVSGTEWTKKDTYDILKNDAQWVIPAGSGDQGTDTPTPQPTPELDVGSNNPDDLWAKGLMTTEEYEATTGQMPPYETLGVQPSSDMTKKAPELPHLLTGQQTLADVKKYVNVQHPPGTAIAYSPNGSERIVDGVDGYELESWLPVAGEWTHEGFETNAAVTEKIWSEWPVPANLWQASHAAEQLEADELLEGLDDLGTDSFTQQEKDAYNTYEDAGGSAGTLEESWQAVQDGKALLPKGTTDAEAVALFDKMGAVKYGGSPGYLQKLYEDLIGVSDELDLGGYETDDSFADGFIVGNSTNISLKKAHDFVVKTKHPGGTVIARSANGKLRIVRKGSGYERQLLEANGVWEPVGDVSNVSVIHRIRGGVGSSQEWHVPKKLWEQTVGDQTAPSVSPTSPVPNTPTATPNFTNEQVISNWPGVAGKKYAVGEDVAFSTDGSYKVVYDADGDFTVVGVHTGTVISSFGVGEVKSGTLEYVFNTEWYVPAPKSPSPQLPGAGDPVTAQAVFDVAGVGNVPDGTVLAVGSDGMGGEYKMLAATSFTGKPSVELLVKQAAPSTMFQSAGTYKSHADYNIDMGIVGVKWYKYDDTSQPFAPGAKTVGAPELTSPAEPEPFEVTAADKLGFKAAMKTANVGYWSKPDKIWDAVTAIQKQNVRDDDPGHSKFSPLQILQALDEQLKTADPNPYQKKIQKWSKTAVGQAYISGKKKSADTTSFADSSIVPNLWTQAQSAPNDTVVMTGKSQAGNDYRMVADYPYIHVQIFDANAGMWSTLTSAYFDSPADLVAVLDDPDVKWQLVAPNVSVPAPTPATVGPDTSAVEQPVAAKVWDDVLKLPTGIIIAKGTSSTGLTYQIKVATSGAGNKMAMVFMHSKNTNTWEHVSSLFSESDVADMLNAPGITWQAWTPTEAPEVVPAISQGLAGYPTSDANVNVPYTLKNNPKISNDEIFEKLKSAAPGQVLAYARGQYGNTKYRLVVSQTDDGVPAVAREVWFPQTGWSSNKYAKYTTSASLHDSTKFTVPDGKWVTAENAKIITAKKVTAKKATPAAAPAPTPLDGQLNMGGSNTSHIAETQKQSLYTKFKHQPATYLDSPPSDIYAALKTIADDEGLSLLQMLRVVDEVGAKKVNLEDKHLFEAKIKSWLQTPQGAAMASGKPIPLPDTPTYHPGVGPQNLPSFEASSGLKYDVVPSSQATSVWQKIIAKHGDEWTASQKAGLRVYTGGSYFSMNAYLYGKLDSVSAAHMKNIKQAQLGMRPSDRPMLLHRGVGWNGVGDGKNHDDLVKKIGTTWKSGGFFSTSVGGHAAFGGPVLIEVEAPPGTPMAWVDPISLNKGENEMLLAAGLHYKIISVKKVGSTSVVRVRVVPPPKEES